MILSVLLFLFLPVANFICWFDYRIGLDCVYVFLMGLEDEQVRKLTRARPTSLYRERAGQRERARAHKKGKTR